MDANRLSRLAWLAAGLVLLAHSVGWAQHSPDRVLIDAQLGRQVVSDLRFEPDRLVYEQAGRTQSAPLDGSVVAVIAPDGQAPRPRTSWIELADGQRLVGAPLVLSTSQPPDWMVSDGEGLMWSTPLLGSVKVPLGALRRVVLRESNPVAEYDDLNDIVVLANGDRMRGLLERLWPEVALEVDGQTRTFDITAISSITLANPIAEHTGSRVWLNDGSIIAVDAIESVKDGVRVDPAAPLQLAARDSALLTISEILAVAFESGGVAPLASLGVPEWRPLSAWALAPRPGDPDATLLGSAEIELIGPVEATWALPAGARRVAIRARLREDCRVWGDCQVSLGVSRQAGDAQPVAVERLHGDMPDATFIIDVPAAADPATLSIRVDEGQGGAIQDRVILDGFVLLSSRESQTRR